MKKTLSIQIKAAFLLLVFGFNTITGFACAIGIDMGFNKTHHHETTTIPHVHADGKKHYHKITAHQHANTNEKDDCCNDKVVKIYQADKAVPQTVKLLNPVFFTAFVAVYNNIIISYPSPVNTFTKYFVRGHHPPIADIRVAIRSFQI